MVLALDYIFVIFFISYLSGLILQSLLSKASKESTRLVSYFLLVYIKPIGSLKTSEH